MIFRYETYEDAEQQLNECVLLTLGGDIVHLRHEEGWSFHCIDLTENFAKMVDVRKLGLSFSPIQIGYVNTDRGTANYYVRNPIRMWKAGLNPANVVNITGNPINNRQLYSKEMADCIRNEYPTPQESLNECRRGTSSVAFHREFAFSNLGYPDISVDYRGAPIGKLIEKRGVFSLEISTKYSYLKEMLEGIFNETN